MLGSGRYHYMKPEFLIGSYAEDFQLSPEEKDFLLDLVFDEGFSTAVGSSVTFYNEELSTFSPNLDVCRFLLRSYLTERAIRSCEHARLSPRVGAALARILTDVVETLTGLDD